MSDEYQRLACEAVSYAAEGAKNTINEVAYSLQNEYSRSSAVYRPAISIDGNKWCALYGANLQDGVAGFGDSPALAMSDFDANWLKKL